MLYGVLFHILDYDDAAEFETEAAVRRMTAGWSDEHKRDELVAVFRRVERQRKANERQRRDAEEFRARPGHVGRPTTEVGLPHPRP